MISKEIIDKYEMTIGLECHVQFNTKTKLFSGVDNDAVGAEPNTKVSPICFGMPGVLPVLNEEAVAKAIIAGTALNAKVANFSKFDRKHYFYPDLPKGYQITQFDQPVVGKGTLKIAVDGKEISIGITRAHLEEDAGKSSHPDGRNYSLVDLNRAGTPLLEIVSDPDMHSPAQARAYAHELYLIMKYAGVTNADLFQGNMRFDVNISIALKGATELGTRSEIKNLNSFKAVEKSAEYEFKRQIEVIESGKKVVQETRGWNDSKQKTFSQRAKEEAHDYRYFPDPDLPPVEITDEEIAAVEASMPVLPVDIRVSLSSAGVDPVVTETLLENQVLVKLLLEVMESAPPKQIKQAANWLSGEVQRVVSDGEYQWSKFKLEAKALAELAKMVEDSKLSSTGAKDVLLVLLESGGNAEMIANKKNLMQESDEGAIEAIVDKVIADNPKAADDIRNGEMKVVGFMVGQIMKQSQGKANPRMAQEMLRSKLTG